MPGAGCRVPGAECRVPGAGCRVPGFVADDEHQAGLEPSGVADRRCGSGIRVRYDEERHVVLPACREEAFGAPGRASSHRDVAVAGAGWFAGPVLRLDLRGKPADCLTQHGGAVSSGAGRGVHRLKRRREDVARRVGEAGHRREPTPPLRVATASCSCSEWTSTNDALMSKIAGLLPLAASRDQTLTRISPIAVCSDVLVEAVIE